MSTNDLPPGKEWRRAVYGTVRITGATNRRGPRQADRRRVTATQNGQCLYCQLPIGAEVWRQRPRHSKHASASVELRPHWDHFVPYSYTLRNAASNWALACHVCNGIKLARMFDTVDQARSFILPSRASKGYEEPESVLHRLRLADSVDFELGVRMPTLLQLRILGMVAAGHSTRAIAEELKVSSDSVNARIATAAQRLRVSGRKDAVAAAVRYGFLTMPSEGGEAA